MVSTHEEPNYMAVFYWLFALTILEVGIVYMPLAKFVIVVSLVGLACSKAALVALYFMHLRFERSTLGIIALTPPFLLVLLTLALVPDSVWKVAAPVIAP
jgi:cytochrome c oxidase subunit 4